MRTAYGIRHATDVKGGGGLRQPWHRRPLGRVPVWVLSAKSSPYATPSATTPSANRKVAASSVRAVARAGRVSAVCQA
ncbi:hypothetical protein [Streptomyces sp. SD31]|uniref:hypothetical protein n=1 Tax=Streptomyces sp. SD31 TaxID=3452208 RepID=UPI003F8C386F